MSARYIAGRAAEYEARTILQNAGYDVMRAAGSHGLFDLIAWKNRVDILLIQVKRTRSPVSASAYHGEITRIAEAVSNDLLCGDAHLWILSTKGWIRYLITSGGAVPVTWEDGHGVLSSS